MKRIIIIKDCNKDNLQLHRVDYTSNLLDILIKNIIKELSLEEDLSSKEDTPSNKMYDSLNKDVSIYRLLDIINNRRYDSIMKLALRDIAKSIDIKTNKSKVENRLIICITGQREPFKTIIEEEGHKVSSSVSKKTDALVNANNEKSSKAIKAQELGIPILKTEEELRNFLK